MVLKLLLAALFLVVLSGELFSADKKTKSVEVITRESNELTAHVKIILGSCPLNKIEARVPSNFGLSPPREFQTCIESISVDLGTLGVFLFPKEAHRDLFNTGILYDRFSLGWTVTKKMSMDFSGGSGEKWYRASFEFDPEKKILVRKVFKLIQGEWLSEWHLNDQTSTWEPRKVLVHDQSPSIRPK